MRASGSFPACANVILIWLYCRCTPHHMRGSMQQPSSFNSYKWRKNRTTLSLLSISGWKLCLNARCREGLTLLQLVQQHQNTGSTAEIPVCFCFISTEPKSAASIFVLSDMITKSLLQAETICWSMSVHFSSFKAGGGNHLLGESEMERWGEHTKTRLDSSAWNENDPTCGKNLHICL